MPASGFSLDDPWDHSLIRRYQLGPPLVAWRSGTDEHFVVELRRATATGQLWSLWRSSGGSTGTPVSRTGTAWELAGALVVAGEARRDASLVEVIVGAQTHRVRRLGSPREWLLLTIRNGEVDQIVVRQLDASGRVLEVQPLDLPPATASESRLSRRWRHRWSGLRGIPAGRCSYSALDPS